MPSALDPRKKPKDIKVFVSTGAGVDVDWADGHHSHYDFAYLRERCPCATCNDERAKKAAIGESVVAGATFGGSSVLPMYKPKPGARSAEAVGNYAIRINFNDGHSTGIFSYDYLRTICPCSDCARAFRSS